MEIHKNRALVIGPYGQMVQVRTPVRLKEGWRVATAEDISAYEAAEVENKRKDAQRVAAAAAAEAKAQADREATEKAAIEAQRPQAPAAVEKPKKSAPAA